MSHPFTHTGMNVFRSWALSADEAALLCRRSRRGQSLHQQQDVQQQQQERGDEQVTTKATTCHVRRHGDGRVAAVGSLAALDCCGVPRVTKGTTAARPRNSGGTDTQTRTHTYTLLRICDLNEGSLQKSLFLSLLYLRQLLLLLLLTCCSQREREPCAREGAESLLCVMRTQSRSHRGDTLPVMEMSTIRASEHPCP